MVFGVLRINSPRHKNNHTLCWLPPPLTPSQPIAVITGFYRDASSSWSSFSPDHLFPFTLYSKVLGQRSPKQKYFRLENPLSSMFIQFGGDREKTLCKSIALRIFLFVYPQNILQCSPNSSSSPLKIFTFVLWIFFSIEKTMVFLYFTMALVPLIGVSLHFDWLKSWVIMSIVLGSLVCDLPPKEFFAHCAEHWFWAKLAN